MPQIPTPRTVANENAGDISFNMKEKKKSTLISLKNGGDTPIYEIKLRVSQGSIKFIKAKEWEREKIDSSTVVLKTGDRPITTGKMIILIMITDNTNALVEWSVLDRDMNAIGSGTAAMR